jgi:hypothetical protein
MQPVTATLARKLKVTLAYLALAYFLMLSYQIFTQTAVSSIVTSLDAVNPFLASLLGSRVDLAVFVCSFAWTFVLSSIITSLIFGRERRISIHFFISLGLTVVSGALIDLLKGFGLDVSNPNLMIPSFYPQIFNNSALSFLYLALPFFFMVAIDLKLFKKIKR